MRPEQASARDVGHKPLVTSCGDSVASEPRAVAASVKILMCNWG